MYTIDQVLAMNPCGTYPRTRITNLFANRDTIDLLDVLNMPIPDGDKIWFATRPGVLTEPQTAEFLNLTVTRAVTNHALNCGISEIKQWAKKWLSGEDRTISAAHATRAACWAAHADKAARAAKAACWAAHAVDSAACDDDSAVYSTCWWAAFANADEHANQIEDLKEIINNKLKSSR